MTDPILDLDAYLGRIRLSGAQGVNEDRLEALHRAQVYTIPFENFDILLGRGIALEPEALVDKLVHRRRGGYCFELNGLLRLALEASGFEVRRLLARVHMGRGPSARDPPTRPGNSRLARVDRRRRLRQREPARAHALRAWKGVVARRGALPDH